MKKIGRIKYVTKGLYSPDTAYTEMNVVLYGGSLWECIKDTQGNTPPENQQDENGRPAENEYWQLFLPGALGDDYIKKTDIAVPPTETEPGKAGVIIPDGKTITEDPDGTIHGASQDKVLTNEEMQEILASGEAEDGTKAFVSGIPAAGNQGILLPLDVEVKNSMNAVRNFAIKKEIDRLDGLIAEAKELKASLESFGMAKICPTDVTSVTEDDSGLVLGAKEKNASVEGTLGNQIVANKNKCAELQAETSTLKQKTAGLNRTDLNAGFDTSKPETAPYLLYKGSSINWSGIGCDPAGTPKIRFGTDVERVYSFRLDGIYLDGNKITN